MKPEASFVSPSRNIRTSLRITCRSVENGRATNWLFPNSSFTCWRTSCPGEIVKTYKEKLKTEANLPDRAREFIQSQITLHGLIANAIRQIGDGMAWRAFDYDRFTTRILCSHPVKQTILAEGTVAEVGHWAAINDSPNRRAIFNAVTNSIAIGDVTAIDDNGDVELIEVKSGNAKSRRLIRQKQILRDAAGVLTSGSGVVEGKSVSSGVLPLTPKNHLGGLRDLLAEAGTKGWSAALLAPHCYVECADFFRLQDVSEIAAKRKEMISGEQGWGDELDIVSSSMDLISFVPNAAPLTVFPLDDRSASNWQLGPRFSPPNQPLAGARRLLRGRLEGRSRG